MTLIPLDMKNPVINNAPYESYWRLVSDPPPAPGAAGAAAAAPGAAERGRPQSGRQSITIAYGAFLKWG